MDAHKGRNRHHFEYWIDVDPAEKIYKPVKMPLRFLAEMFCDRVAASKIYRGEKYRDSDPLDYFLSRKPTRSIHPETSDMLEKLLRMLAIRGRKRRSLISGSWLRQVRNTKILNAINKRPRRLPSLSQQRPGAILSSFKPVADYP